MRGPITILFALLFVATITTQAPAVTGLLTFDSLPSTTTGGYPSPVVRPGAVGFIGGNVGGIGFGIYRMGGEPFDIIDNNQHPADTKGLPSPNGLWGSRSLDPFYSFTHTLPYSAFIVTFDTAIHIFSVLMGDYGSTQTNPQGDNDTLKLEMFTSNDASGIAVATTMDNLPPVNLPALQSFTQKQLTVTSTQNIHSVKITGGEVAVTDFMTVFLDRMLFSNDDPTGITNMNQYLTDNHVFDPNFIETAFDPPEGPIPEPISLSMLTLLAPALLARRRRK